MEDIRNQINLLLGNSYSTRINNLEQSITITNAALNLCTKKSLMI